MNDKRYKQAVKRIKTLKLFYTHLFIYLMVNVGLICINILFSSNYKWFIYPLIGWGIGIFAHGLTVLLKSFFLNEEWEKRKLEKYLE